MKKIDVLAVLAGVVVGFLIPLNGCGGGGLTPPATGTSTATATTPPPLLSPEQKAQVIGDIKVYGADAVDLALASWSASNNQAATHIATALKANIEATLLPTLNGNSVSFTAATGAVVGSLYLNVPQVVSVSIQAASMVLDHYYSIPGVQESDKVDFIRAFVQAVDDGCTRYLAAPPPIGKTSKSFSVVR